ncbi:terminase gpA endonuclease subunit [uncultured Acetatifactor sp.]|uniref:terminase gpA endonuclease subunit n=1 Tax=uncultured Acetatifactor sp. TaxID=1671927 RepID=UPI0026199CEE|nr:terminase gpA endonuclease subunit [uncultured Acetatifactor sp.]
MLRIFSKIKRLMFPRLKVSRWADRHRRISQGTFADAIKWDSKRALYQQGIMDAVSDDEVEEVIIMSSGQAGKTEMILNIIGYYIDHDPSPILCLQPTLKMAQIFSMERLSTMFWDTPVLRRKIKSARTQDTGNGILHRTFPGGHITIAGMDSACPRSRPIKVVLMDEVDSYPVSARTRRGPMRTAEERTKAFRDRKMIKASTPTIRWRSRIEAEYLESSREEWCVRCPRCRKYQPFAWERIHFSDVTMECRFCGRHFEEAQWKKRKGKWIASAPGIRRKRGFHINALSSPWMQWKDIIEAFLEADRELKNGNEKMMQMWVNNMLGETWDIERYEDNHWGEEDYR